MYKHDVYIRTHTRTCVHKWTRFWRRMLFQRMIVRTDSHTYTHTHTHDPDFGAECRIGECWCVLSHICIHTHSYNHTHSHTHTIQILAQNVESENNGMYRVMYVYTHSHKHTHTHTNQISAQNIESENGGVYWIHTHKHTRTCTSQILAHDVESENGGVYWIMHVYTHTQTHTHIHEPDFGAGCRIGEWWCVLSQTCIHPHSHAHTHAHTHTHINQILAQNVESEKGGVYWVIYVYTHNHANTHAHIRTNQILARNVESENGGAHWVIARAGRSDTRCLACVRVCVSCEYMIHLDTQSCGKTNRSIWTVWLTNSYQSNLYQNCSLMDCNLDWDRSVIDSKVIPRPQAKIQKTNCRHEHLN